MRPGITKKARNLRNNSTDAEKCLWGKLKHAQLGAKFRRQHPVQPYIVDFCCVEKKLVVEVDGGQHCENSKDKERTKALKAQGYKVLRFWNNEVLGNIEGVVETIMNVLNSPPPLTPPPASRRGGGTHSKHRSDFPVLQKEMNGKPVVYLDTAASAQKPQMVIDAMSHVMENHYTNIHRGLYEFSQKTTTKYEAARTKIAAFIGASSAKEVIFTRNATEAINLVAQSWGRTFLQKGDEIILTAMEHHANIVPWQLLQEQIGVELKIIPVLDDGTLDMDGLASLLSAKTRLVSFVHISNALGTINPAKEIIETVKAFNPDIKILVDGSQAVVHGSVHVEALGCDFYVFSGHKLYGPSGIGVLWGRYEVLESMPPYQGGGDMIERVSFEKTTYKEPPARFEAGTPAIVEVIGLGAAIDYLQAIGMDHIVAYEQELLSYAVKRLQDVDGLTFYGQGSGKAPDKAGIISFTADWGHPSDISMILDQCSVAVRTGHHCCMPLMQRYGIEGTIRLSLGLYSNTDDIDALVEGLQKAKGMLA